jgi:phosphatidylglycerol lysyltransferase
LLGRETEATLTPAVPLSERELRALPWAEAQLVRQGDLALLESRRGQVWVSRAMGISRLFLGQPLASNGRTGTASESLAAAQDLADREALWPLLYKVAPRLAAAARAAGWTVLPVAREAVLDPIRFNTSGSAFARLRRKLRAAEKAGVVVEWPSTLPFAEMKFVSDAWVRRMGGERGLSMGRWARDYVAGQRVALARDASGQLVAFVTFHAGAHEWTLDLMRSQDEMPDGTLYLLVTIALRQAAAEGIPRLSLAAVPEETFGLSGPPARWARRLTQAWRGLDQFKEAFNPRWERRYIAAPGRAGLAGGVIELALGIRPQTRPRPRRGWVPGKMSCPTASA